jgi:hypothetical protein
MQVFIKQLLKNIPVTTVILGRDYDDPEGKKLKPFFCYECADLVQQIRGRVGKILPGDLLGNIGTYIKCNRCHRIYSFILLNTFVKNKRS